jgi:hypothetical protein
MMIILNMCQIKTDVTIYVNGEFGLKMMNINIQSLRQNITLHFDIVFIQNTKFLLAVLKPIDLLLVGELSSKSPTAIDTLLSSFKRLAMQRGFDITDAYCDNEATFGAVSRTIPGMVIHHTASRGHEKVIERHTRFLKERCRAVLAGLPYDLPNILVVPFSRTCCISDESAPTSYWSTYFTS